MEDKKMDKNYCEVCGSGMDGRCGRCGHYCGFRGGHILRWVLGIIIIVWIFSIGVKFGELKAYLEGGEYGYPHMRYNVMPMMYGNGGYFESSAPAGASGGTVIYSSAALPKK